MAQVDIEFDDREMEQLRAVARARRIDPGHMTRLQLLQALTVPIGKPSDAEHAKRLVAVMSVHGMWKGDPDKPRDAVEYQREVRAEWP